MGKLNYSPREITNCLENKLGLDFGHGRERIGWYVLEKRRRIPFMIPKIHRKWGKGTIADIVSRSRLTKDEFRELVDCPLTRREYESILRQRLQPSE